MSNVIPIRPNAPFQSFSVNLGDATLLFSMSWVTRFAYFRLDIDDITGSPVRLTSGRTMNPDVNLLSYVDSAYGRLWVDVPQPTLEGIGINSVLRWSASNG